jgi:hypothetical protein
VRRTHSPHARDCKVCRRGRARGDTGEGGDCKPSREAHGELEQSRAGAMSLSLS